MTSSDCLAGVVLSLLKWIRCCVLKSVIKEFECTCFEFSKLRVKLSIKHSNSDMQSGLSLKLGCYNWGI